MFLVGIGTEELRLESASPSSEGEDSIEEFGSTRCLDQFMATPILRVPVALMINVPWARFRRYVSGEKSGSVLIRLRTESTVSPSRFAFP